MIECCSGRDGRLDYVANKEHVDMLGHGVPTWNRWREANPEIKPDLSEIKLSNFNLSGANLSDTNLEYAELKSVNLSRANLERTYLYGADLTPVPPKREVRRLTPDRRRFETATVIPTDFTGAILKEAVFHTANLVYVRFVDADLTEAQLWWTELFSADFTDATLVSTEFDDARLTYTRFVRADLTDASLVECSLVNTDFEGATLTGCNVYGIAAWDVNLNAATQSDLVITPPSGEEPEPAIMVDSLEVAQFIYLLLKNEKLRDVIETMTSTAVLILGNFAPGRKEVLEAIKERLRERGYLPILFDFDGPNSRDIVETVTTVARLSRFVIADITQPRTIPDELRAIVPDVGIPVVPLIEGAERPYAAFGTLYSTNRLLGLQRYKSSEDLLAAFDNAVLAPAETRFEELQESRQHTPAERWVQTDEDEEP